MPTLPLLTEYGTDGTLDCGETVLTGFWRPRLDGSVVFQASDGQTVMYGRLTVREDWQVEYQLESGTTFVGKWS